MKTNFKWLAVLLTICLLVTGLMAITAVAEDMQIADKAEKDGVEVSLTISDKKYEKTGEMSVILSITNVSGKYLTNVSSTMAVPDTLNLESGDLEKSWESMTYSELAQNTLVVTNKLNPFVPEDGSDPDDSGDTDDVGGSNRPGGIFGDIFDGIFGDGAFSEIFGDSESKSWVLPVVLCVGLLVIVGLLVFFLLKGRIKKTKNLCLLLLVGVLLVSMAPAVSAAEEDTGNTLTVEKEFTIGEDTVKVSATVTWSYAEEVEKTLTRADMEDAIVEMAWTWYYKGSAYQYDSTALNSEDEQHLNHPLCGYCGGKTRLSVNATMEDATSHSAVFSVCSGYAYDVYKEALGYPLLGSKLNSLTMTLWRNTSYPDDMAILRWHTKGKDESGNVIKYNGYDTTYNINYNCWYDTEEVYKFFENYKTTMRPGDIIVFDNPGHAVMYVGNGIILNNNGKKYSMETGMDGWEDNGTCDYVTVEDYFFNPDNRNFYVGDLGWCENSIVVARPLNVLTIDDGDGDPSNDLLNPEYELNTGLLKAKLESDKTTQIKTSGYGIDKITETRMKYPCMTIDRTSSITPYGTAAQGSTITYKVVVTNNSNMDYYADYKHRGGDADFEGVDYKDLWVVERIPEGTELYSALGAVVEGDTLHWNIDIPAGESRTFAYTVKVTGDIGNTIVSEGGWVANIPSNSITNIIGGKKLSSSVGAAMGRFFRDGRDVWNSNEGYKISANVKEGTHFAERVYQETAGLNLQLPEVQEIMNIFFHEYKVYEPYGVYLYHDSSGITRHMYSLNDKAPNAADQIYYNMLVPGYYGGQWCYTDEYNGEPRINELRAEYLEIGDVLVYINLTESESDGAEYEARAIKDWTVVVYLGNDTYASLSADGRLEPVDTAFGRTQAFSHDLFVCLRPSQVYENINKDLPAYDGKAPDLTDADKRTTYVLSPSEILLNEEGCRQFAELSIHDYDWIKVNGVFTGEVYEKLGMDIVTNGTNDASFATLLKNLFDDEEDDSAAFETFGHHYFAISEPRYGTEKQMEMLLYYGGDAFADEKPISSMNDLHPGDAVMLGSRTSRFYVTAIYQGNGNFLLNVQSLQLTGIQSKIWGELHFKSSEEFMAWLDSNIAPFAETLDTRGRFDPNSKRVKDLRYEGYLVMRPSRAFTNINTMVKRALKAGALTDGEKNALSALTPQDWKDGGKKFNLNSVSTWAYGMAGINTSQYLGSNSIYAARNIIFAWEGSRMVPKDAIDEGFDFNYSVMLVPEYYGGKATFKTSKTFTPEDFQIGDLFCGAKSKDLTGAGGTTYYVAVYQGNGQFLMVENGGVNGTIAYVDATFAYSQKIADEWSYYYVLRPERIATVTDTKMFDPPTTPTDPSLRDMAEHKLTESEKEIIASLGFTAWSKNCDSMQLQGILPWVYKEAGIDATMRIYGYRGKTYDGANSAIKSGDPYYKKLLVAGTHAEDVTGFGITNLQIGDIFCGRVVVKAADGSSVNLYYGALYQGNDKFLSFFDTYDAAAGEKGRGWAYLKSADFENITWDFRYVLRPEQLSNAPAPAEKPRDTAAVGLTEAEKNLIAGLTRQQWADDCGTGKRNVNTILPWVYDKAGINLSANQNFVSLTVSNIEKVFSGKYTGADLEQAKAYYSAILVEGSYGKYRTGIGVKNLVVGDIFCGWKYDKADESLALYHVGIYQGNDQWLMMYDVLSQKADGTYTRVAGEQATMTTAELSAIEWTVRYVLCPGQLKLDRNPVYRDMADGLLTDAEKNALAAIKVEDVKVKTSIHIKGMLPELYAHAGIIVDGRDETAVTLRNALLAKNAEDKYEARPIPNTDDGLYFKRMLIFYGGSSIVEAQRTTFADAVASGKLQVGDFVSGYDGGYTNALYQGNGKFLIVNEKDAEGNKLITTYTAEQMDNSNLSFYMVFRPEKLTEEVTYTVIWKNHDGQQLEVDSNLPAGVVPTYDGKAPLKANEGNKKFAFVGWTPEVEAVTGNTTYTAKFVELRDMANSKLTVKEMAALAALTADQWNEVDKGTNLQNSGLRVYAQAGIDISALTTKTTYHAMSAIFKGSKGAMVPDVAPGDGNYDATYAAALVPNSYGGAFMAATNTLPEDMLQVGDLFLAAFDKAEWGNVGDSAYYIALYQGNGKFLVKNTGTVMTIAELLDLKRTAPNENNVDETNGWSYYFVIRPERICENRETSLRPLTDAEKYTLSTLTSSSVPSIHAYAMMPQLYSYAGIRVDGFSSSATSVNLRNKILVKNADQKYILRETPTTDYGIYYKQMLVFYGGPAIAANESTTFTAALAAGTLQIGDYVCGYDAYGYTNALYQGNGRFLVINQKDANGNRLVTTYTAAQMDNCGLSFYFVFRPEMQYIGLRDITEGALTTEEQEALSALSITKETSIGESVDLNGILPGVYKAIGIDVTSYPDYVALSGNNARKSLFGNTNCYLLTEPNASYSPEAQPFYKKMLVSGLYGGTAFKEGGAGTTEISAENLQPGDILCAQVAGTVTKRDGGTYTLGGASYAVWVYQGNGKFGGSCNYRTPDGAWVDAALRDWGVVTLEQVQALKAGGNLGYYYVLRPAQLAN